MLRDFTKASLPDKTILALDIGSVSVSLVELTTDKRVLRTGYAFHHGKLEDAIRSLSEQLDLSKIGWVATTTSASDTVLATARFDSHVAHIAACQHLHGQVGTLLLLGGEKFSLVQFNERGEYQETRTNSSCAAGTGSFLDEQARNLGLLNSAELSALALEATGAPPKVASRCAVFAKTDIIHAQQEGYSRQAICNGLCLGLATIISDTLFAGEPATEPVIVAGGLARNQAVTGHLAALIGCELNIDEMSSSYGALGAALLMLEELTEQQRLGPKVPLSRRLLQTKLTTIDDLWPSDEDSKSYFHDPLELTLSAYPSFESLKRFDFAPEIVQGTGHVEFDVYEPTVPGQSYTVSMGLDIGSTSTKAVLLNGKGDVLVGAYTRTHGRPVSAMQAILESLVAWQKDAQISLQVTAVGTTGSGRKLVGSILGADRVVDEITAHARAAVELDPEIDTIIEIGGQDAKFTTLRQGRVTSAVMNTVCAAGTGSFIEEQARRLGCGLSDYADSVDGARSPMTSDRCTVFMQRDVNHLLATGYTVPEILAAVLHSVRENYLQKVAREGDIGKRICFQGATAKNRALVAAFEQKLQRPIKVSRFCHLTGALGAAHIAAAQQKQPSKFRGFELYQENIPLEKEICTLCNNHCKVVKAQVQGEVSAYGFLCGRDYDTQRFVSNNRAGFDLLKTRNRIFRTSPSPARHAPTIGIPASLYLVSDLSLWRRFFENLGFKVITSEACPDPVGVGKKLAKAEFCAPIAAFHGHVAWLADKADFLFIPFYLEAEKPNLNVRRQYCYYSQYAPSLIQTLPVEGLVDRCIMPLMTDAPTAFQSQARLYSALRKALPVSLSFAQFASAHRDAVAAHEAGKAELRRVMLDETAASNDVAVVMLGRPYTCLPLRMNKRIPDILASLGVKTFFQDMLSYEPAEVEGIEDLLDVVHWNFASKILEAAEVVAQRKNLYPVLVTSFKCAPDSCTTEYFRRIMDAKGKPYLILELDEHESSVGYETRIEAAVGAFRNHAQETPHQRTQAAPRLHHTTVKEVDGKTLVLPNWDRLTGELLVANLRAEGVDALLMQHNDLSLQKSLRMNTGQCIPMSSIAQGFIDTMESHQLDPAKTVLWTIDSRLACNIGGFSSMIKTMVEQVGHGFEQASVYRGEMSFLDFSIRTGINAYFAYMFAGLLRRLACHTRPYEQEPGTTDQVLEESLATLRTAFLEHSDKMIAVQDVVDRFAAIPITPAARPKVAIFGDLYTRDNDVMNQDLIRFIEQHGGEVVTTPYSVYARLVADTYFKRWIREGNVADALVGKAVMTVLGRFERKYTQEFSRVLGHVSQGSLKNADEIFKTFAITDRHSGESVDNLFEIYHVLETVPEISLFVQAAPGFCCPALVTEAMTRQIERVSGVPVLTITYDGTASPKNEAIIPYLKYPRRRSLESIQLQHS